MIRLGKHFLRRVVATVLIATLAVPVLAASAAHAETGRADTGKTESGQARLSWSSVVSFRNLDPADPRHRQTLLGQVEAEASKLCDGDMVRSDRRACEAGLVAKAVASVSQPVRQALALAQKERNEVAQAMR